MSASSTKPLNFTRPTPSSKPKKKLQFAEAVDDIWQSIFNWTFLMLIITPKPTLRQVNEYRQHRSQITPTHNIGFLSRVSRFFAATWRSFSTRGQAAFSILLSPFTSKSSKSQAPILPYYIPPIPRDDTSFEQTIAASSITLGAPNTPDDPIQIPAQAALPTHPVPHPDPLASPNTSPTTAKFLATLRDLESRMNNHQFYDLERELAEMDNHMAQLFDFAWMPRKNTLPSDSSELPAQMILPQAPLPARRDGKTIQILPMIYEVSENSPDLANTPPYDPRRWSIITFQPLWGPRVQVGAAY